MNIALGLLIVLVVVGTTSAVMLLVRRRAPAGSYFSDGDRAAGVFGVLATGFSVLLAFIIVLGYQAFDDARSGAETEAILVAQQVETAQFFAEPARSQLGGQLVCYGRTVVGPEWLALETGALDAQINPWAGRMFQTTRFSEDGLWVSGEFFQVLGVRPAAGRLFVPADDVRGCGNPGVVLSHAFWQREYGGAPVVGSTITVGGHPLPILGVTEAGIFGVEDGRAFD